MKDLTGALIKTRRTPEADYRPSETAFERQKTMNGIVLWQSEKGFACVQIYSDKGVPIYKECFFLNELELIMTREELSVYAVKKIA